MPRARVNGIEIDYEDGGRGPAILLSHGYSATGRMWAPQRPVLEPSYRLITWDMRGHGQTDSPADPAQYSEALTVEDMRCLLAHLGVERPVIGGLSLGGTMSLAFHRRHPEMVRALVICDSGPGYRNDEARAGWNKRAHERAADLEARGLAALTSSSREMQEAMRHHRSAQGLAHAARGMLAQRDAGVMESLPTIAVPAPRMQKFTCVELWRTGTVASPGFNTSSATCTPGVRPRPGVGAFGCTKSARRRPLEGRGASASRSTVASIIALVFSPKTAALWKIESKKSARRSSSRGI